jgi:hypothetical protein
MAWLQNTYTRRFNSRHRQWGRLFGDRYKSVLIESGRRDETGNGVRNDFRFWLPSFQGLPPRLDLG